ncbi:MAG TPA: hypothetical protein VNO34_08305 [Actinomycetota bacterium]|nr:hypothetical protein [Actinomycetota bacterium]
MKVVLVTRECPAGAPDAPELGPEVAGRVRALARERDGVIWVEAVLARPDVVQLLTHATVFVCPSTPTSPWGW